MKQLTCEMCGSTDLMKQDGVFVCQTCGCKYSVEEAKKMMIEGVVDVQGTVTVDNTSFVKKYLQNARRAKDKEDWEETEKYYNLVEQNDPSNIEAIFYSAYAKAKMAIFEKDTLKYHHIFDVLTNSISIIDDNYSIDKSDEEEKLIKEIYDDIKKMFIFVGDVFYNVSDAFIETIENIIMIDNKVYLHEIIIDYYDFLNGVLLSRSHGLTHEKAMIVTRYNVKLATPQELVNHSLDYDRFDKINSLHKEEIKKLNPNYVFENNLATSDKTDENKTENNEKSSSGCYVATAVYGSYDCPEVWTLRRYRDNQLAKTWYGRLFIQTYYAISPTIVKWFGDTEWFKRMWKAKLDKMVSDLQSKGVESTPYEDRKW